jgi:small GTP-binding protein
MWDTAGQEAYRSITQAFSRNAGVVILCYSITDRDSFNHIEDWKKLMADLADGATTILVGAKKDLRESRTDTNGVITLSELSAKAERYKWQFIETSSKTFEGIEQFKELLAQQALAFLERPQVRQPEDPVSVDLRAHRKKKCC